jgi:hypothetical protein
MNMKASLFLALGLMAVAADSALAKDHYVQPTRIAPPVTNIYNPNWGYWGGERYEDAVRRDHQMNHGL